MDTDGNGPSSAGVQDQVNTVQRPESTLDVAGPDGESA